MRHRSQMDDPFSDILKFTNAQSVVSGGFVTGGAWAIRFPPPDRIKFFALVRGSCWLAIDGDDAPVHIAEGDVFLLARRRSFVLASDLGLAPIEARRLFDSRVDAIVQVGEGDGTLQIGGHVRLDPAYGDLLTSVLPPLIHVHAAAAEAGILRWLLDQLVQERSKQRPGCGVASAQLAQLMLIQILRVHFATSGPLAAGWLRAASDRRIAPALRLMHGDPGRSWQLGQLAKAAAMSRTTFALYFKSVAGVAPLTYLTAWRMRLATRALREEDISVAVLARRLGYSSESAFSNAFKRVVGIAPRRYRSSAEAPEDAAAGPITRPREAAAWQYDRHPSVRAT